MDKIRITHYKEYTIIPIVRVLRVMQDFVHQQYGGLIIT